jgi:hypothetical protein
MTGITDPAQKYFKDGLWTYDGAVWRPQNQLIAYRARIVASVSATSTGASPTTVSSAAVPTGYVHIIQAISAFHDDTVARAVIIIANGGGATVGLATNAALAPFGYLLFSTPLALAANDIIQSSCYSLTSGKKIYVGLWGHSFKIDE